MAVATSSLPTPLSPVTRTFASDRAIRSISCISSMITALFPMSSAVPCDLMPSLARERRSQLTALVAAAPEELFEVLPAALIHRRKNRREPDLRVHGGPRVVPPD